LRNIFHIMGIIKFSDEKWNRLYIKVYCNNEDFWEFELRVSECNFSDFREHKRSIYSIVYLQKIDRDGWLSRSIKHHLIYWNFNWLAHRFLGFWNFLESFRWSLYHSLPNLIQRKFIYIFSSERVILSFLIE
jgi:hypothetical protein